MGNIKQTGLVNTVNAGSGGGGGGSDALILAAVVVVGAWMLVAALAALVQALVMLLIWLSVVLGLAIVLAVVLGIVFRDKLKAHFGGPRLIHVGEASLLRDPDRDMPKLRPESSPREIHNHLHFHGDSPDSIRRAVEAAALAGGGIVTIPAGEFDMRETR